MAEAPQDEMNVEDRRIPPLYKKTKKNKKKQKKQKKTKKSKLAWMGHLL
jgi:uncharacterized protein YecT (DUF1311 family)